jgi:hypothetical protein
MDMKAFDSHVSAKWLKAEHEVYRMLCPDSYLAWVLGMQIDNRCRSGGGITYRSYGKRMSGEFNTSLGNNVINLAIYLEVLAPLGKLGRDYDFILDGDDSVLSLPDTPQNREFVHALPGAIRKLGWTAKVEEMVTDVREVQFCQTKMVEVGDATYRMVREPLRAISRALVTVRNITPGELYRYVAAVGECELASNRGVPVLEAFGRYLLRHSNGSLPLFDRDMDYRKKLEADSPSLPITARARASFHCAFGLGICEQVMLERYFDSADHRAYLAGLKGVLHDHAASMGNNGQGW